MDRTPVRFVGFCTLVLGVFVAGAVVPAGAATKTTKLAKVTATTAEDRIAMPQRVLPPTVQVRRALGAVYVDRVNTSFDVRLGTRVIGRIGGVVDLATNGADLRFLSADANGKLATEPFIIRVRGDRIQVQLPSDLRTDAGVDGYVTSIKEGSFGGVGVSDEVILSIALLTSLPIPKAVEVWSAKSTAKAGGSLRGVATRKDFTVLSSERFGTTAAVEVRLLGSGVLRDMSISFSPLKAAKASGAEPIKLVGTVARSTKSLAEKAPDGEFVTAAKLFDLAPVPETQADPAVAAIDGTA